MSQQKITKSHSTLV